MLISNLVNQRSQEKAQLILLPTIDPDPIVNCGPGENSGQYVEDRSSNCKNYTDCGLNNNTVWIMMLKADCDIKHVEQNNQPPAYACDCSKTCSQISTCLEAYYQLNNCGCSIRDGDDDDVPCENLCF